MSKQSSNTSDLLLKPLYYIFSSGPLYVISLMILKSEENICQCCNVNAAKYKFSIGISALKFICVECFKSHCETKNKTNRVQLHIIQTSFNTISAGDFLDNLFGFVQCSQCRWKGPRDECLHHHIICPDRENNLVFGSDRKK